MSGNPGAGCVIMRCQYWDGSACAYPGDRCRYNATPDPTQGVDQVHIRLKLALDALGEISDKYWEYPNDREESAQAMREIADSALRRLSLNRPDA